MELKADTIKQHSEKSLNTVVSILIEKQGITSICLDAFKNMQSLVWLDLSRNYIENLDSFQYILSLEYLCLYYNRIRNINELKFLQNNKKLKELDLRLNPITTSSTYLSKVKSYLPFLQRLDQNNLSLNFINTSKEKTFAQLKIQLKQSQEVNKNYGKKEEKKIIKKVIKKDLYKDENNEEKIKEKFDDKKLIEQSQEVDKKYGKKEEKKIIEKEEKKVVKNDLCKDESIEKKTEFSNHEKRVMGKKGKIEKNNDVHKKETIVEMKEENNDLKKDIKEEKQEIKQEKQEIKQEKQEIRKERQDIKKGIYKDYKDIKRGTKNIEKKDVKKKDEKKKKKSMDEKKDKKQFERNNLSSIIDRERLKSKDKIQLQTSGIRNLNIETAINCKESTETQHIHLGESIDEKKTNLFSNMSKNDFNSLYEGLSLYLDSKDILLNASTSREKKHLTNEEETIHRLEQKNLKLKIILKEFKAYYNAEKIHLNEEAKLILEEKARLNRKETIIEDEKKKIEEEKKLLNKMKKQLYDEKNLIKEERERWNIVIKMIKETHEKLNTSHLGLNEQVNYWKVKYENDSKIWRQNFDQLKETMNQNKNFLN